MGIEYSMVKYIYKLKTLYLSNEFSTSSLPKKNRLPRVAGDLALQ